MKTHQCLRWCGTALAERQGFLCFSLRVPERAGCAVGREAGRGPSRDSRPNLTREGTPCHVTSRSAIKPGPLVFPKEPLLGDWLGIGLLGSAHRSLFRERRVFAVCFIVSRWTRKVPVWGYRVPRGHWASGVAARGHGGYQAWAPAFPLPGVGQPCQTGGVPWSNEGALALGDTGLGLRLHGALACSAPPAPHRHGELRPPKWPQARAKGLLRASTLNKTHEHPGHRNGSFRD